MQFFQNITDTRAVAEPLSLQEIIDIIKPMKTGKAAGPSGHWIEWYKIYIGFFS